MAVAEEHICLAIMACTGPEGPVGRTNIEITRGPEHVAEREARSDIARCDHIGGTSDSGFRRGPVFAIAVATDSEIGATLKFRGAGAVASILAVSPFAV